MNCTGCGKTFDGNEIITFAWLLEHAPDVAARLRPHTLYESKTLPEKDWPRTEYVCGTICPHCGHANDAPGFAEGDDIPHRDSYGTMICATRYLPPQQIHQLVGAL